MQAEAYFLQDEDYITLTPEQMIFMLLNHNRIQTVLLEDDYESLCDIACSQRYSALFGTLPIATAFAAYEASCMDELRLCAGC